MLPRTTADIYASADTQRRGGRPDIKVLRQHVHDLKADGQNLLDRAKKEGRELTEKEDARLQELETELAEANKAVEDTEAHLERERAMGDPAAAFGLKPSGSAQASPWRDLEGNPIAVLSADETVTAHACAAGGIPPRANQDIGAGEFLRGLVTGHWPADFDMQAGLAGGSDTSGGYLLNPRMSSQVIDLARNQSVLMRAGAQTVPMRTAELSMVKVTKDPSVSWTGENEPFEISESTFGRLTFRARKMGTIVKLSQELVEDAPNAAQIIESQLAAQLALEMDRAGLLGAAKGAEPRGLFEHPDVQEMDATGHTPSAIDYDHFLDALKLVEDVNGSANAMIYAPSTKNALAKLKDSEGNYLSPPEDVRELRRLVTKQLGDSQATVGDFTQVMFGVRIGIQIETSRIAGSAYQDDQIWIRARWRGDVQLARPDHLVRIIGIGS